MSRENTNQFKAVAIILMFFHHFFGFPGYMTLPENEWRGIFLDYNTIVTIGRASKICVPLFMFCSGYGLYKTYISKRELPRHGNLIRTVTFLTGYWAVLFLVAIPYQLIMGTLKTEYFIFNPLALINNDSYLYVSFSWYVKFYFFLLLLLPLIRWAFLFFGRYRWTDNPVFEILVWIALPVLVSWLLRDYYREYSYEGIPVMLYSSALMILSYLPMFIIGALFCKYSVCEGLKSLIPDNVPGRCAAAVLGLSLFTLVIVLRCILDISDGRVTDPVYSPIIASGLILFFGALPSPRRSILQWIGKYSFQYWLLSGMFFLNTPEFQWIVYLPKYTAAILIWMFAVLALPAFIMKKAGALLALPVTRLSDR